MLAVNRKVLVLNSNWSAVGIVDMPSAIGLLYSQYPDGEPRARIVTPPPKGNYEVWDWSDWSALRPEEGENGLVSASKIFKIPEVVLLSRYGSLPEQKVNFCRRSIWKRDDYTCFTPETLILMADLSLRPINQIKIGDKIIDAYGNIQKVEYVHSREANEDEMISIKHRGNGEILNCTKDHKIIKFDWDGIKEKCEISAGSMTTDDYVAELIPKICGESSNDHIDLYELANKKLKFVKASEDKIKHYSGREHNRHIKIDNNLGKLCGYYLSEGCVVGNVVTFSFHSKEKSYGEDVVWLIKTIFGIESKWTISKNKGQVICCSSIIGMFFSELFGKKNNKKIGLKTNKWFMEGLLYGICRGDASFNNDQFRCTIIMSRPSLIREIYLISLILGLHPSISKTYSRKDGRIYKTINFNAEDYNKIAELCFVPHAKWIPSKNNKKDRKLLSNHLVSKITEIKPLEYKGLVYDLQISGSHTYVANFICVHNCQYCGKRPREDECTLDHVVPKSLGGDTSWTNCVLACYRCNSQKADRRPEEAYRPKDKEKARKWIGPSPMRLLKKPVKPEYSVIKDKTQILDTWKHWLDKLYWEVPLE